MKTRSILIVLLAAILLVSCVSKKQKEQTISISGAFALYPLVVTWAEEYKKIHPEIRFNISGGGAGKGMADALAGAVDLGMFSREVSQEEIDKGAWYVGLTVDAVVPSISDQNPYYQTLRTRGMTKEEFSIVFLKDEKPDWGAMLKSGNLGMTVYTRSDACGAAETWAKYLGARQEDLKGIGIFGDPGLAEAVTKDPAGIGFNNTIYAYDISTGKLRPGIGVIPIDINANGIIDQEENFYDTFDAILDAIGSGKYPSPPARELYFISKGKPENRNVIEFIKWTLTDGQAFVKESGYVPIPKDRIEAYLKMLE